MDDRLPFHPALYGTVIVGFILLTTLALLWHRQVLTRRQASLGMVATVVAVAAFMGWVSGMSAIGVAKLSLMSGVAACAWFLIYGRALDVGAERRAAREAESTAEAGDARIASPAPDNRPGLQASRQRAALTWALICLMLAAVATLWIIFFGEIFGR